MASAKAPAFCIWANAVKTVVAGMENNSYNGGKNNIRGSIYNVEGIPTLAITIGSTPSSTVISEDVCKDFCKKLGIETATLKLTGKAFAHAKLGSVQLLSIHIPLLGDGVLEAIRSRCKPGSPASNGSASPIDEELATLTV